MSTETRRSTRTDRAALLMGAAALQREVHAQKRAGNRTLAARKQGHANQLRRMAASL